MNYLITLCHSSFGSILSINQFSFNKDGYSKSLIRTLRLFGVSGSILDPTPASTLSDAMHARLKSKRQT